MNANVKRLVYGALCVALSFALSYVKLFSMPMGGSVTLCSMLPLMVYAHRFGLPSGLLTGLAYGLLQLVQKPEIVHIAQLLLDYPLAFMAIGLAAIPKKSLPLGTLFGGAARAVCHIVSGAIFFGMYAPEGVNAWWYSFCYNGAYLGVDTLICFVIALLPPVQKLVDRITVE